MESSIGEPFLLSTYATSQRLQKSAGRKGKKQKLSANVFATHEKASGSSDGYATVTAQADGIHILDISTLHPVISHTLGPSTTFSCPAITIKTIQGADNVYSTYAVIESSSELDAEENGRTVWMWRENTSGSLADRATQKKVSMVIPHLVAGLYHCEELSSRILAQSWDGDVTITDLDLDIKHTRTSSKPRRVYQTFVYPRRSCSFVPPRTAPSRGAIVLTLAESPQSMHIEILAVDDDNDTQLIELGDCPVPLKQADILSISCSNAGFLTIISRDGSWHTFQLESRDGDSLILSPATETFRLTGLSFISNTKSTEDISLLSLGSSHVLLTAVSKSPAEIVLLLWDLQYSVLLAYNTLPIPSSLTESNDATIKLTLVHTLNSQAILLLSPTSPDGGRKLQTSTSRSSVLVVPFTVPATSTIANAMGRASFGAKWIDQGTASSSKSLSPPTHDPVRSKVLATMTTAMQQNLPQAANVAFFEWEKRETVAAARASDLAVDSDINSHPALDYAFVKDLLTTIFQLSKPANTPYSSEVLRYLLDRRLVSGTMVGGGLLAALRLKGDWQSIELALKNVIDITETELMQCLQLVVARYRQNDSKEADAMEIDSVSDLPTLPAFLASCVTYPTSPAILRSALRHSFNDPADIVAILKVLNTWVNQWGKRDIRLLPSKKDVIKNEHGVLVLKAKEKEVHRDLPPLLKILSFLQTLLDASFLALLQYPPSHTILRSIFSQIEPEISYLDQIEQLRGPLEPFVKAHTKAIREAGEDKRKQPVADWRQRRKQAHEQAGLSIGLYQLEELVL
ncbi:hypothetical protein BDZ94DRAFT_1262189 [Collybia nuda]|uniref:Uncharacterized protein n=1 Tax=Collybia nuda TaxID=64659 RepID=A0A9P5Y4A8_9AGAR|nr:hypothetical protein BDZ94DRAFT_1262189 [Collybia nuda]